MILLKKNMSVKISVLVVNLNNLLYTKQCIEDLLNQDVEFNLRLVDQNSTEEGTNDFFNNFFLQYNNGEFNDKINFLEIIHTGYNCPLNHLWNEFVNATSTDFLCLLKIFVYQNCLVIKTIWLSKLFCYQNYLVIKTIKITKTVWLSKLL